MISDHDKWVPDVNMSFKDRAFYVLTGLAILFVLSMPYIPVTAWEYIVPPLAMIVGGAGIYLAAAFIIKGVRGRW